MTDDLLRILIGIASWVALVMTLSMTMLTWIFWRIYRDGAKVLLLAVLAGTVNAQPEVGPPAPKDTAASTPTLKRRQVPAEAWPIALAYIKAMPPEIRPFVRCLWVSDTTPERVAAGKLMLGYLSLSSKPIDPPVFGDGAFILVDITKYAPRINDTQLWIDTWEKLQNDPESASLLTKDHIELLKNLGTLVVPTVQVKRKQGDITDIKEKSKKGYWVLEDIQEYKGEDGKRYNTKWVWKEFVGPEEIVVVVPTNEVFQAVPVTSVDYSALKDLDVVRFNGPHIDPLVMLELQNLTASLAPVVSLDYFFWRAGTTIKDKGVFKEVYGGLYYEFAKVRTAKEAKEDKLTDLDVLFKSLGLGDNAKTLFDELRSDQRIGILKSKVTGKWRVIFIFPNSRTGEGRVSVVMVSLDPRDQDIDHRQNPFLNLADPKGNAHEVIWIDSDGLPKFGVFSAIDGKRLDSVGQDIAADRTVPNPNTPVLQPFMGCASCHCASGSSLWIEAKNDVKTLLEGRSDIFGDLGDKKKTIPDTTDRLGGLYEGDTDLLFQRGRDDFNVAVHKWVRPKKVAKVSDLTEIGMKVTTGIVTSYNKHRYEPINAQQALREYGFIAENNEQAVETLKNLLPPDKESVIYGIAIEDPRVQALMVGLSINRVDFDLIKPYTSYRVQKTLATLPKDKKNKVEAPKK